MNNAQYVIETAYSATMSVWVHVNEPEYRGLVSRTGGFPGVQD